jgi:hypothetical protein
LRTKGLSTTKGVATLVYSAFATCILFVKNKRITRAEAQAFLAKIVSLKLERIEAFIVECVEKSQSPELQETTSQ